MRDRLPKGIIPPLAVPFKDNKLERNQLTEHINSLVKAGVHGFFLLGSVGQGILLTREERVEVLETLRDNANGRDVVVQVGGTDWETIISTVREAEKYEAKAIATLPPIYYKPDYQTLKKYLEKLTTKTQLPTYIYNIPRLTGFDVTPEIMAKLIQDKVKIVGIKDTVPDLTELLGHITLGLEVFAGLDSTILPALVIGSKGVISSLSNSVPELVVSVYKNTLEGNFEEAKKGQALLYKLSTIVSKYPFPSVHYSLIKLLRYDFGSVKEPLIRPLSEDEERTLKNELKNLGFTVRD